MKAAFAEPAFLDTLKKRHRDGNIWKNGFLAAAVVGIVLLFVLAASIINDGFGYVVIVNEADPSSLSLDGVSVDKLSAENLRIVLADRLPPRRLRALEREKPLAELNRDALYEIAVSEIIKPHVTKSYPLGESLFAKKAIIEEISRDFPDGILEFRSWVSAKFLFRGQSGDPMLAGVRTAVIGSLLTILITLVVAFPLGVGAAIWLEEYARDTWLNQVIRVNIYNLAGVPSIIYGMLGLAVFVRYLEPLSSGSMFGLSSGGDSVNGRTILSAGLTLALLILPVIIINAQEALRAVPQTLRQSGLALGATKWQTIYHHVLPACMDRILTGTVLAVSRALGETAPLIVVGASTFLTQDPTSIFSKFTTLPIQIYQWTSRPQGEFHNLAAGAIIVLLALMLSLNAFAVIARNRMRTGKKAGL